MVRITDPERSRAFYEALGFRFSRDLDIVRNGELEATNYFFSLGDQDDVLELTYNHDGRTYEMGTAYGHIAIGVDDLDGTLARLAEQGIEPERPPYTVREGGSRLCFVRDPDGYRIELIERRVAEGEEIEVTRSGTPVAVIAPPRARLISAERFRELLASAPPVDEDFAEDARRIRREAGPAPENPWPS